MRTRPDTMPRRIQRPGMFTSGDGSTLSLDFTSGVLDPRFTFTRSTTATFINSSGYVESIGAAASNDPTKARFDYDPTTLTPRGLLSEGSASNLLSYSQDFSNAAWTKSNTNGSMTLTGTAPDNNATSRLLEENTTSYAKHSLERSISISAGIHTFSVWLKEPTSNSRRYAHIQLADGQSTAARYTIVADLQTGTITASGANIGVPGGAPTGTGHSITAYPNGWYRVTISMNHVSSPSYPTIMLGDTATLFGGNNQPFYSATTPYKGLLVWGAQFETGSGASSYIPTGASTGTRAVDTAIIAAGTAFSGWYTGGLNGTFYADWYGGVAGASGTQRTVLATDDVTTKHLHLYQTATTNTMTLANYNGTSTLATSNAISPAGSRSKAAFSYATSAMNVCLNGGTVASGTVTGFTVAPTWMSIGAPSTNGTSITGTTVVLNNSIRSIKYWPTVLPNAQLQALTT